MMKGKKYSALEIVSAAFPDGVTFKSEGNPDQTVAAADVFGKFGVNIGGVSGIVTPDHKIMISEAAEQLIVRVGNVSAEVSLEAFVPEEPVAEPVNVTVTEEPTV